MHQLSFLAELIRNLFSVLFLKITARFNTTSHAIHNCRKLIKALLTKRKLTDKFRLKRGNLKTCLETDDVTTDAVMLESNEILVEKLWIINLKDGNEEILEDLKCLEGLMKMKLDLGLKPGTLKSAQVDYKAQLLADLSNE